MKLIKYLALFILGAVYLSSCSGDTVVYEGGYSNIVVQHVQLNPENWLPTGFDYEWEQPFEVPRLTSEIDEYGAVLIYMLDNNSNWTMLPQTIVLWDDTDGTVYSEEIWYSYRPRRVYFYYRNTFPVPPAEAIPATNIIKIKMVLLEAENYKEILKDTDLSDHNAVMEALNINE